MDSSGSGQEPLAVSVEDDNEPLGRIKAKNFFTV
jgi:hypothetical protein